MRKSHKSAKGINFESAKSNYRQFNRKMLIKSISNWVILVLTAIILGYSFVTFGVQTVHVNGIAMEPTLSDSDVVVINKFSCLIGRIDRYDIVAIKMKETANYYEIKRVVAMPGETIQIVGGNIVVDGQVLDQEIFDDFILNAGIAERPYTLGANEYFVVGDNINNSEDSRYSNYGAIYKSEIKGKVFYRILPEESRGAM